MTDKCAYPYCRRESDLQYGPVYLCNEHWRELCTAECPAEFRRAIGVELAEDGTINALPGGRAAGTMDED